jgi:hypothetical protein
VLQDFGALDAETIRGLGSRILEQRIEVEPLLQHAAPEGGD